MITPQESIDRIDNADLAEAAPTSIYHWQRNLTVFLKEAFEIAGLAAEDALKQAQRTKYLLNPQFDVARATPVEVLKFAFRTIGFSEDQSAVAASTAAELIAEMHGRLHVEDQAAALDVTQTKPGVSRRVPINRKAIYHWQSNLTTFLKQAYVIAGFDSSLALDLAYIARDAIGLHRDSERFQETDWESADPYAILMEAFIATGFDTVAASLISHVALTEMGVPGWQFPPASIMAALLECPAYEVKIIWCDAAGQQHTEVTYMYRNAWESLIAACPATHICTWPEEIWYTLILSDENCVPDAPEGACVWIRAIGVIENHVDCDDVTISLDCFDETKTTINCSAIEQVCGHYNSGPSGCPDCG